MASFLETSITQSYASIQPSARAKAFQARSRLARGDCPTQSRQTLLRNGIALSTQQVALCKQNDRAAISVVLLEIADTSATIVDRIGTTWQILAQSTPVLRTQIQISGDGNYFQVVQPFANAVQYSPVKLQARDGAFLEVVSEQGNTNVTLHIHPALVDQTSLAMLQRDFILYINGCAVEPTQTTEAYSIYTSTKDPQLAINYWRKSFPQAGDLSCLYSFPQTHQSPRLETVVTANDMLLDALLTFADKFDVRPHDVLYAAWALVAGRHAHPGQRYTCFTVEGRDVSFLKHESVIGWADQKFPLILPIPEDTNILAWVSRVRNVYAEASCNAFVGYQQILEITDCTQPQTKLVIRLTDDDLDVMADDDDFALVLNASVAARLKLSLRHNSSVPACDARTLLEHVLEALKNMLGNPFCRVSEIDLSSRDETDFILQAGKAAFKPQHGLLHSLVEQQAKTTPDLSAIQFESNKPLSYAECNMRANQLARQMSQYRGSVVPVLMRTTPDLILALLAILKAGAAYVVLDPDAPSERNRLILETTEATQILVDNTTAGLFENQVQIEDLLESSEQNDGSDLAIDQDPNETAYIIFTSGSTGKPKAAVLDHNAAYNGLLAFPKTEGRRQLLFFNPVFSAAQRSIWTPLCTGGCLCLASKENLTIHTARTITSMNINSIEMTSTTASLISPESTPCLQRLALGGEMPTPALVQLWGRRVELLSSYGLSECTQLNARHRLETASQARFLGRAFDTTTTFVLSPGTNILSPLLIPGELCFGGIQLAKGYLRNSEETKKRFIKNPFGHGKLYRTGDLALRRADGSIELLGRIDFQVKINGQKVDPAESNSIIQAHRDIKNSAVVSAVVGKKTVLVAMVVSRHGSDWDVVIDELRSTISRKLPLYMVPSFWVPASSLPLNPNQKTDMGAIRKRVDALALQGLLFPAESRNELTQSDLSDTEQVVRKVWSDFLPVRESKIHIEDSFLALGGTSLEAVQVASKLHSEYSLTARVEDIVTGESLAEVARRVQSESQNKIKDTVDIVPFALINDHLALEDLGFQNSDVEDAFPVTPFQEGVITNAMMGGVDFIYRRAYTFKNHSPNAVKRALQMLMKAQPLLRTTFTNCAQSFLHIVRKTADLPWETSDSDLETYLQQEPEPITVGGLWWKATVLPRDILVITAHHALFDYWSNAFIPQDIACILRGDTLIQRTPFNRYVQYIQQQDETTMHDFWRDFLTDMVSSRLGSMMAPENTVAADIRIDMKIVASQLKVTPGVLLYTAWAIALAQACSNDDVVFGITLSGRDAPITEITQMSGPTLMIAPLRVVVDRTLSFAAMALQVQATLWKVARNAPYGMRNILKAARQTNNVFDTAVNFLIKAPQPSETSGLTILPQASLERNKGVKLELDNGLLNEITLSSTLHTEISQSLVDLSARILECFKVSPHGKIGQLDGLHSPEAQWANNKKLIPELKSTSASEHGDNLDVFTPISSSVSSHDGESYFDDGQGAESPATTLAGSVTQDLEDYFVKSRPPASVYEFVHAEIQKMAVVNPSNIAVQEASGQSITYSGLLIRANQLATLLRIKGVRAEQVVPLMLDKSINTVIVMLGVMISGGAYVTLDGKNPKERNSGIIEDVGAKIAITDRTNCGFFRGVSYEVIVVEDIQWHHIPIQRCPAPEPSPDDLAYIVYTSGSTGKPKGTLLSHRGLAEAIQGIVESTNVTVSWRCLWALNYVFDGSFHALFAVLSVGGTLCLAPQEAVTANLAGLINSMQVTEASITPTMASLFSPDEVPGLEVLCIGGEPVPPFIPDIWARAMTVYSLYGPTEASICVSGITVTPDHNLRNVGRPFKTVTAMILDPETLTPVPTGEVGELCLAGPQLARGYLNRPEATDKAFCTQGDGTRIYLTGDLAKWLPSGEIELFGRKDDQIKLNGYRIELGEIENVIMQNNDFSQCVVIVATVMKRKQLVAFCLSSDQTGNETSLLLPREQAPDWRAVAENLRTLSSYMIPTVWFSVSRMPLSVSGKANKKELLAFVENMDESLVKEYLGEAEIVEVREGPECVLQSLWSSILNVPREEIHARSTFHGMGGDSIAAINLVGAARRQGFQIAVTDILSHPSLRDQTPFLKPCGQGELESIPPAGMVGYEPPSDIDARLLRLNVSKEDVEDIYPCGPGQVEFLTQGNTPDQFWQLFTVRRLPAGFDFDRWVYLTTKLTKNNPILRTFYMFVEENNPLSAIQVVLKHPVVNLTYRSYRSEEERQRALDTDWEAPFAPGRPCVRYMLLEHSVDGVRDLVIKLDHASYDGSLLYIFDDQFVALNHNLPYPAHIPFRNFIHHVSTTPKQPQLDYWERVLGSHEFDFPSCIVQPKISNGVTGKIHVDIGVDALAEVSGVTVPIVFQTAYTLLLSRLSGSHDIVYDNLISGRHVPIDNPQLIAGTCANFVPCRSQIPLEASVASILNHTQVDFWTASENGLVSLGEIYDAMKGGRHRRSKCLFCFQPFEPSSAEKDEDPMRWIVMKKNTNKMFFNYAVNLEIRKAPTKGEYVMQFTYDERALTRDQAQGALEWYRNCLRGMARNSDALLRDLV